MTTEALIDRASPHLEGLTLKQQLFVVAFVQNGGNGTQACRDGGYSDSSDQVLAQQACQNLSSPKVADAVAAEYALQAQQLFWSRDRVIWELTRLFQRAMRADQYPAALSTMKEIMVFQGLAEGVIDSNITINIFDPTVHDDPSQVIDNIDATPAIGPPTS